MLRNIKADTENGFSPDQEAKLAALQAEIGIGLEQARRGEFTVFTAEDIISEGRARIHKD